MEDPVLPNCTVQIIVNGVTKTMVFPLHSTIDVEFVEKKMRSTYNVTGGTLSSSSQLPVFVYTLVPGGSYYFLEFTTQGAPGGGGSTGYETRRDWTSSVFFLFVELPIDWGAFTMKQLKGFLESAGISVPAAARNKENLVVLCNANLSPRMRLEISGTAFAITPRRFITCHHCVYDEKTTTTLHTVAICSSIVKQGDKIVPDPASPLMFGDLHCFDVNLDFAIFNLRGSETHALLPIPVCPEDQLPGIATVGVICVYYCAIGDFQVSQMGFLRVWRGGPYSILQYGHYTSLNDPPECRILLEHGLCRGSSGGAIVVDGHVAAMHLASLNQGRHVWRHVRGSSLAHSVGESITDMEQIHSAYKEGLVLCRVPAIMDAINNP